MRALLRNRALSILLWTNGLVLLAGAMLGPVYAFYIDGLGGGLLDAGFAAAAFACAAGLVILLSGRMTDRVGRPHLVLVIGYVIMGCGFLSMFFVQSIWWLFAVQVLIGFGEAVYVPAFDALYSRHLDPSHEARQWSAWESLNYFTTAGGAVVGGAIAQEFGFGPLFLIMGILCLGSGLLVLRNLNGNIIRPSH